MFRLSVVKVNIRFSCLKNTESEFIANALIMSFMPPFLQSFNLKIFFYPNNIYNTRGIDWTELY